MLRTKCVDPSLILFGILTNCICMYIDSYFFFPRFIGFVMRSIGMGLLPYFVLVFFIFVFADLNTSWYDNIWTNQYCVAE